MNTNSKKLAGKVALVTGGSRGIGASIAKRLAADGASVAITYSSSPAKADEVVRAIESTGGKRWLSKPTLRIPLQFAPQSRRPSRHLVALTFS